MSDLQQQLAHLRQRMAAAKGKPMMPSTMGSAPAFDPADLPVTDANLRDWLDGVEVETAHGSHFECRRTWQRHQRHGSVDIADLQMLPADLLEAISEGAIAQANPARIAYLDTETTGLAGGSGTYAFLIGVGAVNENGFELRHFFLRDYCDEPSQLSALSEHLAQFDVLVTYNGRTYDQPLLETRYRMCRMVPPFARMVHLDLLYGARRLYRLQFDSCRLVELENQILGVERQDDVPGSLIPFLYFEYLKTRAAHRLASIFEHNAYDILTLACLTGIIPRAFHSPLEVPLHRGAEMVGLARWLRAAGRTEDAVQLFRRAIDRGLKDDLLWRTLWDCAQLEKKCDRTDAAVALFTELTTVANPHRAGALEELAKFYEHTEKNYGLALDMTEAAMAVALTDTLRNRRERLLRRLSVKRSARLL